MKYVNADEGLKVFDIRFDVTTAGPSPNENKRIELFLLGCDKAMRGDACAGCFNRRLWDANLAQHACDIESLAKWIIERTPEDKRYITIGGAEPTMQIDYLIPFCKMLKNAGFHIMIYTYRELLKEFKISNKEYNVPYRIDTTKWFALLENIDMVVDGPFKLEQRLYEEEKGDGFLSSIGSGNQRIWDIQFFNKYHQLRGYAMKDLKSIQLGLNDDLIYYVKQESKKRGVVNVNN
jgi:organic radical activating enzyme